MNVLVYSGPEVVQVSLNATLSSLRSILLPNYSVQTVTHQALTLQPWFTSCALLVFPECRRPFQSKSSSAIQTYIENGGSFLGLSTGAVFSSHGLEPEVSNMASGSGTSEPLLRFRQMTAGGYIYPTYAMSGGGESHAFFDLKTASGMSLFAFETGRKPLVGMERLAQAIKPLAKYVSEASQDADAVIAYDLGRGRVVLCAPSLEYNLLDDPAKSAQHNLSTFTLDHTAENTKRYQLLQDILSYLGLSITSSESQPKTRPLPQFLVGNPSKPGIVSRILELLAINPGRSDEFQDTNDTFRFHLLSSIQNILISVPTGSDPASWQPKHIIVCPDQEVPTTEQTPLFNLSDFFSALSSARDREALPADGNLLNLGDALFYGEVVTSTQTMLDKNPRLLSSLPVPFVSLASYQLAGRGRGANVWLSPTGCLQFSILIRVSLADIPANKLVFVQYLFALAVAEACRTDDVLGPTGHCVKLKWPNDLYAVAGDDTASVKKIGGILVNTSFSSGKVDIVIGCGINVANKPPITSLSQLLPPRAGHTLTQEKTLAAILTKFDAMWTNFLLNRGSFDAFMDLYLERWLHSDQVVTVTTTTPHQRVRVVGITPDHGLLRTIPERPSRDLTGRLEYFDLQPDGNSFDLMAGMIRSKS